MWLKKIRKDKVFFTVLGLILLLSTMILSACFSFSKEVEQFIKDKYSSKQNSNLMLTTSHGMGEYLKKESNSRTDINKITIHDLYSLKGVSIKHKGKNFKDYEDHIDAILFSDYKSLPFTLDIIKDSKEQKCPGPGEVWVQYIVADNHDINVNDVITIKKDGVEKDFKVSALVNDSRKPVSMTNGAYLFFNEEDRDWIAQNELEDYVGIYSDTDVTRLQDWVSEYETDQYKTIDASTLNDCKTKANLMTTLVGALGSVSAILLLIISVIILSFFLKNAINSDYAAIGTYKSVGFSTRKIISFYFLSYGIVGSISIVIGALLGIPISILVGNINMKYIGDYQLSSHTIVSTVCVIVFSSIFLLLIILLTLLKIRKITPAVAFQVGKTSTKARLSKSLIKNAHSSFCMAINDIFKNKFKSIIVVVTITLSLLLSSFLINMCVSFNHMDSNAPGWISQPDCDYYVSVKNSALPEELTQYINNSDKVKSTMTGCLFANLKLDSNDEKIDLKYASITALDNYDKDKTHVTYEKGVPPKSNNEIALDVPTINSNHLEIGDTISVKINDVDAEFILCGGYNSMMRPSAQVLSTSLDELNLPKEKYNFQIAVMLKDGINKKDFKQELNSKFDNLEFTDITTMTDNIKVSIMSIMLPITIIIIIAFLMFTLLNIIHLILSNYFEQQRNYGIMKACGYSTGYIVRRNVTRFNILFVLGTLLALIANYYISPNLFYKILQVRAYSTNITLTSLFIATFFIVYEVILLLFTMRVRKITPRKLMEE